MTSRTLQILAKSVLVSVALSAPLLLMACASSSITHTGALSSYDGMTPVKTTRAKARYRADETALAAARTVRIAPVVFTPGAGDAGSPGEDALIANSIGRTLCARLNSRFDIVPADAPADLTIKVAITRMTPTDAGVVGATLALRVAGTVTGVPFPVRVPLGLGAFSAEGEAVGGSGVQEAAMVWARGADMFTTNGRVSKIGDAYEISGAFASDMATLVTTATNPLHEFPSLKSGGKTRPLSSVCLETYGKGHGMETRVAGFVGAPPGWTDKSAPAAPSH